MKHILTKNVVAEYGALYHSQTVFIELGHPLRLGTKLPQSSARVTIASRSPVIELGSTAHPLFDHP
jgi:hypothetical protein